VHAFGIVFQLFCPWREELAPTTHLFVADFHFFPLRAAFRTSGRHVFVSTSYINTVKGLLQGIGVVKWVNLVNWVNWVNWVKWAREQDFGFWIVVERGGVIFFKRVYAPLARLWA
jgi:hypothetical protein